MTDAYQFAADLGAIMRARRTATGWEREALDALLAAVKAQARAAVEAEGDVWGDPRGRPQTRTESRPWVYVYRRGPGVKIIKGRPARKGGRSVPRERRAGVPAWFHRFLAAARSSD